MNIRVLLSCGVLVICAAAAGFAMHWSYFRGPSFDVWAGERVVEARALIRTGDLEGARRMLGRIGEISPAREAYELGRFFRDGLLGDLRPNADTAAAEAAFAAAAGGGPGEITAKALLELSRIRTARGAPDAEVEGLLRRASDMGDRRASTQLALRLLRSDAPPIRAQALRLLWGASWSDPAAAIALARLYRSGAVPVPTERVEADLVARAKQFLARGARNGAIGDMMSLGRFLRDDDVGQRDLPLALAWFRRAAAAGSLQGMVAAADLLLGDDSGVRDAEGGAQLLAMAADAGSPDAAFRLGLLHTEGRLQGADATSGRQWLERAVAMGSAAAMVHLAEPLMQAAPGTAAFERGTALVRAASGAGSASAAFLIGKAIEQGRLDGGDPRSWYELAAQRGSRKAMSRLIEAHRIGDIANVDPEREMFWIRRSLENGGRNTTLMRRLAEAYLAGTYGLPRDLVQSAHWFELAAERGSSSAMLQIAEAYANGGGVPLDAEKAVYWYTRAAERGSVKALDQLARAYASGFGVRLDPVEAFKLFLRAARAGSVFGLRETGRCYAIGFGVEADPERALEFYEAAAAADDTAAMLELSFSFRNGYGTAPDPRRAFVWIERAALRADKNAQFLIGRAYLEGDQVTKDITKARTWLRSAMALGSGDAERLLAEIERDLPVQGTGG